MSKQSSKSDHTEEEKAVAEILVDNFAEPSEINDAARPKDYTPVVAGAGSTTATVASGTRSKKNNASTPYDALQDKYSGNDDDALIDTRKGVNLAPEGGYTPLTNTSQRRKRNKRPSKLFTNLDGGIDNSNRLSGKRNRRSPKQWDDDQVCISLYLFLVLKKQS